MPYNPWEKFDRAFAGSSVDYAAQAGTPRLSRGSGGGGSAPARPSGPTPLLSRATPYDAGAAIRNDALALKEGATRAGTAVGAAGRGVVNNATQPARNFLAGLQGNPVPGPLLSAPGGAAAVPALTRTPTEAASRHAPVLRRPGVSPTDATARIGPLYDPATDTNPAANTFNGKAVAGAPALSRPTPEDVPGMAVDPQAIAAQTAASQRSNALLTRGDAARVINNTTAESEILRRIENAAGSAFLKGSPSSRQAVQGALAAQLAAGNAASAQGQASADAALAEGGAGAVAGAATQQQGRALLVRDRAQQAGAERLETLRQSEPQALQDRAGNVLLRRGNEATPVLDANGQPVQAPLERASAEGQITPAMQYTAYQERLKAISESLASPEEKAAAQASLQEEFAPLLGQLGATPKAAAAAPAAAPEGYTVAGRTPDGKTVYRDASGKLFSE